MEIHIHTDHNIEGRENLAAHVTGVVQSALNRFGPRITRVEVHLSDQNGDKKGQNDKRCLLEARLEGRKAAVVTHEAPTLDLAISGAAARMKSAIEHTLGRLRDRR
jgi:hypothetical protein